MTALLAIERPVAANLPADLQALAAGYAGHSRSANTRRGYASDWAGFTAWCAGRGLASLPADPGTVLGYLIDGARRLKIGSLRRHLSSIRACHRSAGFELDTSGAAFADVWRGVCRVHGAPPDKREPIDTATLRRALAALPENLIGIRNRALLLIGYASALRRSELARLEFFPRDGASGWIQFTADGLLIRLGRSKADQLAQGERVAVPFGADAPMCAVRALRAWLAAAAIERGPVFRTVNRYGRVGSQSVSDRDVARIVKRAIFVAARGEGLSVPAAIERASGYAGHSLRGGHATTAAANGADPRAIQGQMRHKKFESTAGYIRAGRQFRENSANKLGL